MLAPAIRRHASAGSAGSWPLLAAWLVFFVCGVRVPAANAASSPPPRSLPYVPTTVLLPQCGGPLPLCRDDVRHTAFILSPTTDSSSVDLLSLDLSSKVHARSPNTHTLTASLPFFNSASDSATFTASISDTGTITVFAGDCSASSAEDPSAWTYTPAAGSRSSRWVKHEIEQTNTSSSSSGTAAVGRPSALGQSLSFSSVVSPFVSPPDTYVYGGMCPDNSSSSSSSSSTGQSAATYSNRMLKLSPGRAWPHGPYDVGAAGPSAGPPIAEAGFTLTPLAPSLANRSGTVTQQVSHVLLGGHTRDAFVNMSTAAVWSLPQETWRFVSVGPPPGASGDIDSRSGHTAVVTQDGSALVVLGGWVGDLSRAATPQLAVLTMGDSYDNWSWSVPDAQPPGPGIYGHGAVLLPGNTMMVYGGYEVSTKKQRRGDGSNGAMPKFCNLTTMAWSDEYTNPDAGSGGGSDKDSSSASKGHGGVDGATRMGLGVGLGLGIPVFLVAVALLACVVRRARRKRAMRDDVVRSLSQDASRYLSVGGGGTSSGGGVGEDDEMLERDHDLNMFPWNAAVARDWYAGGHDPFSSGHRSLGYETLRGGDIEPLPPPPSSAHHYYYHPPPPRAARGLYQPTTPLTAAGYEFGPPVLPAHGRIPPIYEVDEDEGDNGEKKRKKPEEAENEKAGGEGGDLGASGASSLNREYDDSTHSDPFLTPSTTTPKGGGGGGFFLPPSPTAGRSTPDDGGGGGSNNPQHHPEVRNWVSDVDAADAALAARIGGGFGSHNNNNSQNNSSGAGRLSPTRRASVRTRSRPNSVVLGEPSDESRTGSSLSDSNRSAFSQAQPQGQGGGGTMPHRWSGSSAHTWGTAKSTFANLREEGPNLLLGLGLGRGHKGDHDDDGDDDEGKNEATHDDEDEPISAPGSPSKNKPRRGWLGSIRRVFNNSGLGSAGLSSAGRRGGSPTWEGLPLGSSDYEAGPSGRGSAGSQLLRRKQGRQAWEAGEGEDAEDGEDDDDWDVERAVEKRLVQVMFTVPKERLRVVNAEIEKEEEAVVVDPGREEREERREKGKGREAEGTEAETEAGASPLGSWMEIRNKSVQDGERVATGTPTELLGDGPREDLASGAVQDEPTPGTPKPRTRVLEMVESFETLSRRESPASSPER